MCGILGIHSLSGRPVETERAVAGLAVLRHRGPDDEGVVALAPDGAAVAIGGADTPAGAFELDAPYRAGRDLAAFGGGGAVAVLGSRRLAIQDLSAAGHQPMCNEDGTLWIAHNGEIYNFAELRAELEAHGHVFRSHTDTEVILHAYEQWGEGSFHRFNGMWALALWDARRKRLLLCRDRFGVKPLVYAWMGEVLVFGSEEKALLATGLVEARADDELVLQYLAHGLVDHTERTLFAGIWSLPPGHLLSVSPGDERPLVRRWYELPLPDERLGLDERALERRFFETIENGVALRLLSDVPVGTCLSGGLDSSTIACTVDLLMRERGLKSGTLDVQKVFSARHPGSPHDEGPYIDAVVAATGAEAHEVVPTPSRLLMDLESLVWHQDEPFGSTSIYAQWEVYRLARERGVVVTLDGQGGDETVAGYPHHEAALLLQLARSGRIGAWLREARATNGRRTTAQLARASVLSTLRSWLPASVRRQALAARAGAFSPPWLAWEPVHPAAERFHRRPIADAFVSELYLDLVAGLPSLLRYADRNSMAHSVEARLPFLDYRLVELAFALPNELRLSGGEMKVILRRAMRGLVPERVLERRDKIAFSTPEGDWMRGPLRPLVDDVLSSDRFRARPYFRAGELEATRRAFASGDENRRAEIWRVLNLELWLRRFVEPTPTGNVRTAATPR